MADVEEEAGPDPADVLNILIATDCHIGFVPPLRTIGGPPPPKASESCVPNLGVARSKGHACAPRKTPCVHGVPAVSAEQAAAAARVSARRARGCCANEWPRGGVFSGLPTRGWAERAGRRLRDLTAGRARVFRYMEKDPVRMNDSLKSFEEVCARAHVCVPRLGGCVWVLVAKRAARLLRGATTQKRTRRRPTGSAALNRGAPRCQDGVGAGAPAHAHPQAMHSTAATRPGSPFFPRVAFSSRLSVPRGVRRFCRRQRGKM